MVLSDACGEVAPHDSANFALALFLLVGIVVSYLPQQVKIVVHRTSEGLSPWFLLLGSISSVSTITNVVLLQAPVLQCCQIWSPFGCFENALGLIQVGVQGFMFLLILVLYMVYFPARLKVTATEGPFVEDFVDSEYAPLSEEDDQVHVHTEYTLPNSPTTQTRPRKSTLWRVSQGVAMTVLAYLIFTPFGTAVLLALVPHEQRRDISIVIAAVFGGISTCLSTIQFLPQIIRTYTLKRPGALSIVAMALQCPGTFLLIYSLSQRPGTNISTYLSYIVAAACQAVLLTMSIWYMRHPQPPGQDDEDVVRGLLDEDPEAGPNMNAPPLSASSRGVSSIHSSGYATAGSNVRRSSLPNSTLAVKSLLLLDPAGESGSDLGGSPNGVPARMETTATSLRRFSNPLHTLVDVGDVPLLSDKTAPELSSSLHNQAQFESTHGKNPDDAAGSFKLEADRVINMPAQMLPEVCLPELAPLNIPLPPSPALQEAKLPTSEPERTSEHQTSFRQIHSRLFREVAQQDEGEPSTPSLESFVSPNDLWEQPGSLGPDLTKPRSEPLEMRDHDSVATQTMAGAIDMATAAEPSSAVKLNPTSQRGKRKAPGRGGKRGGRSGRQQRIAQF